MRGKYSFWTKVLSLLLAGLAITSFFVPDAGKGEVWIPLLDGFCNFSFLSESILLKGILGAFFNFLIAASLLAINTKSVNNVFNPGLSVIFFLLVVLVNPSAAYFSALHPAGLLFVWGQYAFVTRQKFLSMFMLSCAALFYAPLVLVLPLILIISIFGAADIPRVAVKSLGGIVLPFVYVVCIRWMAIGDVQVFANEYLMRAMEFSTPFNSVKISSLFLVGCFVWLSLHSISHMFARLYNNSIITEHILKMEFMCIVLGGALFTLFWGNGNEPVNMVVALPMALLLSHYFTANINTAAARIELILLCCAVCISRLSCFV